MADLVIQATGKKSKTTGRQIRVDMTPMVDLGFLLITFFIFTSVAYQPTAMSLLMPKDEGSNVLTPASKTLTILLGNNSKAICYEGLISDAAPVNTTLNVAGTGLRGIIMNKQSKLQSLTGTADSMIVIIKPGTDSHYGNLVAVLDEMTICGVKKHAVANMDSEDEKLLALHQ